MSIVFIWCCESKMNLYSGLPLNKRKSDIQDVKTTSFSNILPLQIYHIYMLCIYRKQFLIWICHQTQIHTTYRTLSVPNTIANNKYYWSILNKTLLANKYMHRAWIHLYRSLQTNARNATGYDSVWGQAVSFVFGRNLALVTVKMSSHFIL
jgi:hypothetical protein